MGSEKMIETLFGCKMNVYNVYFQPMML